MDEIITFRDKNLSLAINIKEDNIWVSQKQMAELFEVDSDIISYHLKNIYKEGELGKTSTTEKNHEI